MRRVLLLAAATLVVEGTAATTTATTTKHLRATTTQAAEQFIVQNDDVNKKGFLSIPQDDPDPVSRLRRLSYRAQYWEFVPYGAVDSSLANLTMASPGGILGQAAVGEQTATLGGQLQVSVDTAEKVVVMPLAGACGAISPTFECLEHLDSYLPLYGALDPEYQPAAYKFYDSDYAFARERITSSPAFITRVKHVSDIPFVQANVTGYNAITGGTPLADLVAQGRVYMVDFFPLYREGLLEASPNSYLEAPTAVFFVDGPIHKMDTVDKSAAANNNNNNKMEPKLMPLAIKYNVQQSYVVSPRDPHADWFLAKAIFNSLDRDVTAIYHFVRHTAIANIAIAAQKTLASEHPLFRPIQLATSENFGIFFAGVFQLLAPGGSFDTYLFLGGPSILSRLFPYLMKKFDWRLTHIWEDLKARGVTDIPGFLYCDDGAAIYDSLQKYTERYLSASYKKAGSVQGDTELQLFLAALTNPTDPSAYLKGFPTAAKIADLKDVSALLAQILWITGAEHHALNSFRILDFDLVYPSHPGKILAPLPASIGTLSDDKVQEDFISGARFTATEATSKDMYTMDITTLSIGQPFTFFAATQVFAFAFYPLLQKPSRLTNIHLSDAVDTTTAQAAMILRQELQTISSRIIKR